MLTWHFFEKYRQALRMWHLKQRRIYDAECMDQVRMRQLECWTGYQSKGTLSDIHE